MTKILMVCLGNICRSPLAEGILKSKVYSFKTFVDSAGTGGYHIGKKPDVRSIAIANLNGLDITDQRARKFTVEDYDNFQVGSEQQSDLNNPNSCIELTRFLNPAPPALIVLFFII